MLADYAFVDDVITAKEARLIRKHCMDRVEKSLVEGSKEVESRKSKNTFRISPGRPPNAFKRPFRTSLEPVEIIQNHIFFIIC